MAEHSKCDCRTRASRAKILNLDGQVIATGLLVLSTLGVDGEFLPDAEFQPPRALDTQARKEVVADLGSHPHVLQDWHLCECMRVNPKSGKRIVHFDFLCEDA